MIRLLTAQQAQDLDRRSQKEFSLRGEDLMETAGKLTADALETFYPNLETPMAVLCGPGNNAGDGLVVARLLRERGYRDLTVYLLFETSLTSPLFRRQLEALPGSAPISLGDDLRFERIKTPTLFIDALFGVGLSKDLTGDLAEFIKKVNQHPVVSLDLPSGLDATTGEPRGVAICAHRTFTYGQPKAGMFIRQGPSLCGQIVQLDIGFPQKLRNEIAGNRFLIRKCDVLRTLPLRQPLGNKSKYGHVRVWAGHPEMWGASVLTARAAYRMGAGYVTLPENSLALEALPEALSEREPIINSQYTYAVGPGWGVTEENKKNLIRLYEAEIENVVLDADALTLLVKHSLLVRPSWILTPHTGEMSRLMNNVASDAIESDRFAWALKAATKWKCTVLLKGFHPIVAKGAKAYVIPTGNAGLSKAGSGDVLTGMIAGLRAQQLSPLAAAVCGVYLHGKLADEWVRSNDQNALTPSDLLMELPSLIARLRKS